MAGAEIKSALVAKQRILTENETETTFTTWHQSIMFHIVVDSKFSRFTDTVDLGKWKSSSVPNRGYVDDQSDGDNAVAADIRMTASQKAAILRVLLGSIATFAPVISSKFITETATSLDDVFERLRGHYGIRVTGSRVLELAQLSLKSNESYEALWERLSAFIEDNLLKKSSGIKHLGIKMENDEILSPTLQNVTVVLWLRAIKSDLPLMIKQRFATQLRDNTLYSLRDDISESLPSVLAEMQDREFTVSLARGFQQKRNNNKPSNLKPSRFQSQFSSRSSNRQQKMCCLCQAAGRPGADTHFLSDCRHLPPGDKLYISKSS